MTNNKQADAERIAEFLGLTVFTQFGGGNYVSPQSELIRPDRWLASDAGTVAMIEALRTRDICALVEVLPAKIKNLNLALQSAVLELIGGSDEISR